MEVTLISPHPDLVAFGERILSACLKKEGHHVQLIFLPKQFTSSYENTTLTELAKLSKQSDLIGISLMTNFFDNAVQITEHLKKKLNVPVVWGGVHPTIRPDECLNYADMVCVGEGEKTLPELVNRMRKCDDYYGIEGIWFKDKETIVRNRLRPLIQDLDSIPFPDYDYQDQYVLMGKHICRMNEARSRWFFQDTYMTLATRGCPFSCTYCCNNAFKKLFPEQKVVRKRSPRNVIKELVEAKKLSFTKRIEFDDDSFFSYSVEEIREFSEGYKENVGLPLVIYGVSPTTLTREKLSLLVDAGLVGTRIGIQSGSERVNKSIYRRYQSNKQVTEAVRLINEFKNKIKLPRYDIILDNPWESEEDLIQTLMFLTTFPTPYKLSLFSLTFYPGTDLHERAKNEGIITNDLEDVYRKWYHGYSKTYINRLFSLLDDYAQSGRKISTKTMSRLTSPKLRRYKLNLLPYTSLKTRITLQRKMISLRNLLRGGVECIKERDWSRIRKFLNVEPRKEDT